MADWPRRHPGHLKDAGVTGNDLPELKSARATGDDCGRCDGQGTIDLGGKSITCPQCKGTGGPEGNADEAKNARAQRTELRNVIESRLSTRSEFELREVPDGTGSSLLKFSGFASVTDMPYTMEDAFGEFTETVCRGAFQKTIAEGCDTVFNLNHGGLSLARTKSGTLKLAEVMDGTRSPIYGITGLHVEARLDPQNHLVQAMRSAVERQDLDELSFAFRVVRQRWANDFSDRKIDEVSLNQGDCSLVTFAANPHTGGTVSLRQRRPGDRRFLHLADDSERDFLAARARLDEMESESTRTVIEAARAQLRLAELRYPKRPPLPPASDARRRLESLRYPPKGNK